jgi:hypothetical protein
MKTALRSIDCHFDGTTDYRANTTDYRTNATDYRTNATTVEPTLPTIEPTLPTVIPSGARNLLFVAQATKREEEKHSTSTVLNFTS